MRTLKIIVAVVAVIAVPYLSFYPMYYWWTNPELTQMQMMQAFWHYHTGIAIVGALCWWLSK